MKSFNPAVQIERVPPKERNRPHRTISSGGYVYVKAFGHPRATNSGHYVFEHILVVEKRIGRYLVAGEIVHHKDGNKQNNADSNLELMQKNAHHKHHGAIQIKDYWKGKKRSEENKHKVSTAKRQWWAKKKGRAV
jgi:hypothetical protein